MKRIIDRSQQRYKKSIECLKARVRKIKIEIHTLAYVYQHPHTPWYAKLCVVITLGYLLCPIDLIPDFIPILGYVDDLILVPFLILLSIKLIPPVILEECRKNAQIKINEKAKLKKTAWWFSIVIILFYTIVIYFAIRLFQQHHLLKVKQLA